LVYVIIKTHAALHLMEIKNFNLMLHSFYVSWAYLFDSDVFCIAFVSLIKFLSSGDPLSGHFRAVLQREGDLCGLIPVPVMAIYDSKLSNLCKSINPKVESNPFLAVPLIMTAAARSSGVVASSEGQIWIRRQNPYPPEIMESSVSQISGSPQSTFIEVIRIPCSLEKTVEPVTLDVSSTGYYMDVIARKLGLTDASSVLVSR
jgi:hypothetical protein